ncbi:MAG TPA: transglutaminase family protein [Chloroflexota bacterium]
MKMVSGELFEQHVAGIQGAEVTSLAVLDHDDVEWDRVHRSTFLIHQRFRYEYPDPIEDLHHRLMILPPDHYIDQRRLMYRLDVSAETADIRLTHDTFGNPVLQIDVPRVEGSIDFEAWIVVERRSDGAREAPGTTRVMREFLRPSSRTEADATLQSAAAELLALGLTGLDLAGMINRWVYAHMQYAHDATTIHTTAAEALALGHGVCQDYAHVMIALCRLCGLSARYISGHMLGEGGTHAWVEVLLPSSRGGQMRAYPFDPTHEREPGLSYVTIAAGRDYSDVAPTSGTFRASCSGRLSTSKRVGLAAVDYRKAG